MKVNASTDPQVEVDSLLSVEDAANDAGQRVALRFPLGGSATHFTYQDLCQHAEQATAQFPPGRRPVALVTSSSVQHLSIVYACMGSKTPILLLSEAAPQSVRRSQIDAADAGSVFDESGFHVRSAHNTSLTYEKDEQFLIPTSGTTADAKITVLTRSGVVASARASQKVLPLGSDARCALTLPYCHVGGLSIVLRSLIARARVVAGPWDFSDAEKCRTLADEGITHVSLVPTQLRRLIRSCPKVPRTLQVALVGGAACPPKLRHDARAAGWPVVFTYGFSEASSQVCTQTPWRPAGPAPERDVGRPLPETEVSLDERGRIFVRGPTLMSRYLGQPPLEKGAWFPTQDLGFWDSEDRLVVVGRADCTIVSGGENVPAERVEEALCATHFVEEAAVFGVPDEIWGERVVAVVTGQEVSHKELLAALRDVLEPYALPKEVYSCASLPRLGSGKLDRRGARALLETLRPAAPPSSD